MLIIWIYLLFGIGAAAVFWWAVSYGLKRQDKDAEIRSVMSDAERTMESLPGGILTMFLALVVLWPIPLVLYVSSYIKSLKR